MRTLPFQYTLSIAPPLFRPLTTVHFSLFRSLPSDATSRPLPPGAQLVPAEVVCAGVLGLWQ